MIYQKESKKYSIQVKKLIWFTIIAASFILSSNLHAQETRKHKKRVKELAQKKEQQRQEELDIQDELKKIHIKNQNKEVQKRMKKSQKKSKRLHDNKRDSFFRRIFK
jgi:hypothetical protein